MDLSERLDLYARRREQRESRLREFLMTDRPGFLVVQHPLENLLKVFGPCNSVEEIYRNNIAYVDEKLQLDWTDDLPFLEPWIGTGVYANAFGCEYHFRDDNAPHVRYRYHKIEELRDVEYPDYRKSPIMSHGARLHRLLPRADARRSAHCDDRHAVAVRYGHAGVGRRRVLCGLLYGARDRGRLPPKDHRPDRGVLRVQMERIGPELLAQPGHLMPSVVGGPGISISDDNLAVSSPRINRQFALPMDEQLAVHFGGLAIHSCGVWTHTMSMLRDLRKITAIECAVGHGRGDHDPNTNPPADVRRAVADSSLIVKARFDSDLEKALAALDELASPADTPDRPYRLRSRTCRAKLPARYREARTDLWVIRSESHDPPIDRRRRDGGHHARWAAVPFRLSARRADQHRRPRPVAEFRLVSVRRPNAVAAGRQRRGRGRQRDGLAARGSESSARRAFRQPTS